MRRATSLVELIVIIAVVALISVPLARLSTTTMRDIPGTYKIIQSNASIIDALKKMRQDVIKAELLDADATDPNILIIQQHNRKISYQIMNQKIIRLESSIEENGNQRVASWSVGNGKIEWKIWRKNSVGYAVEINSYVEQINSSRVEQKMSNSHVYFIGARLKDIQEI